MPEQLNDQQTRNAFAELRAGELARLRPPGTAAARHTVRRRRRATALAVGLAVLGVAGGVGVVRAAGDTGPPTAPGDVPVPTVDPTPTPTVGESLRLAEAARRAVSVDPEDKRLMGSMGTLDSGRFDRNVDGITPGRYVIRVACAGSGAMYVAVKVAPADKISDAPDLLRWRFTCAENPSQTPLTFEVRTAGELAVVITPDTSDETATGFAYQVSQL
jgi:hypothetical protein